MNVLIIDSQTLIRDGLKYTVRNHLPNADIRLVESYEAAGVLLKELDFQLLIMEINVQPDMGPGWVSDLKKSYPKIRLLIYSAFNAGTYAIPFLTAGADGFVSKTSSISELVLAIDTLLKDGKYLSIELQSSLMNRTPVNIVSKHLDNNPISLLSSKEKEVFELVVQGKTTKEMSWLLGLKSNTISTFKQRIFKKMEVNSTIELCEKAALWQ